MKRAVLVVAVLWITPSGVVAAQDQDAARADYLRAVAEHFDMPVSEVAILGDWDVSADEIPVVLFIAQRAGVSPEALVALRSSGQSWTVLAGRYRVSASTLHVPLRDDASAGALGAAYERYRQTPVGSWPSIQLDDAEIIGLVNVRVISQVVGASTEEVFRRTQSARSFVDLFAQLTR